MSKNSYPIYYPNSISPFGVTKKDIEGTRRKKKAIENLVEEGLVVKEIEKHAELVVQVGQLGGHLFFLRDQL